MKPAFFAFLHRYGLTLAVASLLADSAAAQLVNNMRVKITDVKVGLPAGRFTTERDADLRTAPVVKNNCWAPVSFRLEVLGPTDARLKVVLLTHDGDDDRNAVSWPLGQLLLNPNPQSAEDRFRARGSFIEPSEMPYMAYVRVSGRAYETTIQIQTDEPDKRPTAVSEPVKLDTLRPRDQSQYSVVSLGSNLRGFRLPSVDADRSANSGSRAGLRGGRVEFSRFDTVASMPDHWLGYDAADLVVLATGNAPLTFLQELFDEQLSQPYKSRREALLEWVRRGGKLLISVGKKGNELGQMNAFTSLLPAEMAGTQARLDLQLNIDNLRDRIRMPRVEESFPVVKLRPRVNQAPVHLIPSRDRSGEAPNPEDWLVLQAPYGLGRITLCAFDLDEDPVAALAEARGAALWDWMIRKAGSDRSYEGNRGEKNLGYGSQQYSATESEDGAIAGLRNYIDTFDGVPVISFGWVALFIFLYTLLIGPVEYLFLKKILGRLELTWITFPIIVLSVSAAAYFTAYAVKGKDMKMNKIDVVDVDLRSGRAYGQTWFTIFSPRRDSYSIAVSPKESWGFTPKGGVGEPALASQVDWMAGSRSTQSGLSRSDREYQYRIDPTQQNAHANGLDAVPILVWSTKAFSAQWAGYLDSARPPVESSIAHPISNPTRAAGTVTVNLPLVDVMDAAFVYRGKFTRIPALALGTPIAFSSSEREDSTVRNGYLRYESWFLATDNASNSGAIRRGSSSSAQPVPSPTGLISLWGLLFHEASLPASLDSRLSLQNSALRRLDQSWRLNPDHTEEVLLLVRLRPKDGLAEDFMSQRDEPSPTKLWLRGKPTDEKPRDPVPGTIRQETYLRVFIPVLPPGQ